MVEIARAKPLEERHPNHQMKGNFPTARLRVIRPKPQPPVDPEEKGKRDRDEKDVVKVAVEKQGALTQVGFDELAIDEIGRQAAQKKGIAPIAKDRRAGIHGENAHVCRLGGVKDNQIGRDHKAERPENLECEQRPGPRRAKKRKGGKHAVKLNPSPRDVNQAGVPAN